VPDINRDITAQKKEEKHLRKMNLNWSGWWAGSGVLRRSSEAARRRGPRMRGLALVAARFLIRSIDPEDSLKEIEACLQAESHGENSDR